MSLGKLRSWRKRADPTRFRKHQAARTHRTQCWRGTTALARNSESKTQRRNAFKLLEESNFCLVTISHAKILIERKRNVQISMTSKNLSPMYLGHIKAREERFHQHNRVNPDRQCRETERGGPEQHEESHGWGQKETEAVSRAPNAEDHRSAQEWLRRLTGRLLQKGDMDSLSALPELWKRFQQLVWVLVE